MVGSDSAHLDQEIQSTQANLFKDLSSRDLNTHRYEASETPFSEVLTQALTAPFLADKRLILLKNIQNLPRKDQGTLLEALAKKAKFTFWIFTTEETRYKKSPFLSKVAGLSKVISIKTPESGENANIFQLYEMLLGGRLDAALSMVRKLRDEGTKAHEILGALIWQFERNLRMKNLIRRGMTTSEISQTLRIHPYFLDRTIRLAKSLDPMTVHEHLEILLDCDLKIKRGLLTADLAVERSLFGLCRL
jgi:DNA polymerase III delta subunit